MLSLKKKREVLRVDERAEVRAQAGADAGQLQEMLFLALRVLCCYDAYSLLTNGLAKDRLGAVRVSAEDAEKVMKALDMVVNARFDTTESANKELSKAYHAAAVAALIAAVVNNRVVRLLLEENSI